MCIFPISILFEEICSFHKSLNLSYMGVYRNKNILEFSHFFFSLQCILSLVIKVWGFLSSSSHMVSYSSVSSILSSGDAVAPKG